MDIDLETHVKAPASAVFAFLTEPERMNRWSTARIEPVLGGDDGSASDVGAIRTVTIHASRTRTRLTEAIVLSDPPNRFVYRVFRGPPLLRYHRGEITTALRGDGTQVRWRVRFDFAAPGMDALTRRVVVPELQRSLDALARVAEGSPEVALPERRPLPLVDLAALRDDATHVLGEQRAIADRLGAAGDPKYWFARVYQYVTEGLLAHAESSELSHPEWLLRLIPRFHAYYADNLRRYLGELPGECEGPWQRAYRVADAGDLVRAPLVVVRGLLLGVAAHIEEDLPRALAEVHLEHFRDRASYARFRADYVLMGHVFRAASDRLLSEMPRAFLPAWLRAARATLPSELQDHLLNRRTYDIPGVRLAAFERGRRLADWRDQASARASAR